MSSKKEYISPITLVNKMRKLDIFKQPQYEEEKYDLNKLEFTAEFYNAMNETLNRLALDPNNQQIKLWEGFESILMNFIGQDVILTPNELEEMKMMTISRLVLRSELPN